MNIKENVIKLIIAITIVVIFVILCLPIIFLKVDDEMVKISKETFQYTEELNSEVDDVLEYLANNKNHESLLSMRIELFKNTYIKDILYFKKDYIILSSILGSLNIPQLKGAPDFIYDGKEVWLNHSIVYDYSVFTSQLIKSGNYAVLIDRGFYNNISSDYQWELVYQGNQNNEHFIGKKNIYSETRNRFSFNGYYRKIENASGDYNMGIFIPYRKLLQQQSFLVKIILLLSFLVFILSFYLVSNYELFFNNQSIRIKRGLRKERFYFLYQPIIALETGEIKGVEVLARFKDKSGNIYPNEFIPILIKLNKTWEFTKILFNQVHKTLDESSLETKDFRVSINIFPSDIINMNVLQLLDYEEMINEYNMFIEVIEDEYLEKKEASVAINTLKEMGFRIAIDDFGTGYSNFSSLKNLKIDYLKIDKSFIFDMEESTVKSSLIPHMIDISDSLNLSCVAEGIENELQLKILKQWGIKYGQGYYFSKAVSMKEIERICIEQPFRTRKNVVQMFK